MPICAPVRGVIAPKVQGRSAQGKRAQRAPPWADLPCTFGANATSLIEHLWSCSHMDFPTPSRPASVRNGSIQNGNAADHRYPSANGDAALHEPSQNGAAVPTTPLDDLAVFTQLIEVAERAGRADLVDEFRQRLTRSIRDPQNTQSELPPAAAERTVNAAGVRGCWTASHKKSQLVRRPLALDRRDSPVGQTAAPSWISSVCRYLRISDC
jgi:hypothetical protein